MVNGLRVGSSVQAGFGVWSCGGERGDLAWCLHLSLKFALRRLCSASVGSVEGRRESDCSS